MIAICALSLSLSSCLPLVHFIPCAFAFFRPPFQFCVLIFSAYSLCFSLSLSRSLAIAVRLCFVVCEHTVLLSMHMVCAFSTIRDTFSDRHLCEFESRIKTLYMFIKFILSSLTGSFCLSHAPSSSESQCTFAHWMSIRVLFVIEPLGKRYRIRYRVDAHTRAQHA